MPSRQKFWLSMDLVVGLQGLQAEAAQWGGAAQGRTAQRRTTQGTGRGRAVAFRSGRGRVTTGTLRLSARELRAGRSAASAALALAQRVHSAESVQGARETTTSIEGLTAVFSFVASNHRNSRNVDFGRVDVLRILRLSARELRAVRSAASAALALAQRVHSAKFAQGACDTTKSIEGQLTTGFSFVAARRSNCPRVAKNRRNSRNVGELGRAAVRGRYVVGLQAE